MSTAHWLRRMLATASGGAMLIAGLASAQERQGEFFRVRLQDSQAEATAQAGAEKARAQAGVVAVSDYWLGLECYPADATLRAQLALAGGQGLVIEQVVPDSPAAKAGLQQHDVLIKAGDKSLSSLSDLVAAVAAAKDQELSLEVLRGGKPQAIKATPAKRPDRDRIVARFEDRDVGQLRGWIESMRKGENAGPLKYRLLGPGVMLPGGAPLPNDLSVTITRQGSEPAKITVKRGDKTWETTDEKLSELPDDIRPHIERMLGRGLPAAITLPTPAVPGVPGARVEVRRFEGRVEDRMEKQLQELNEQMEKLRRQVEEMQRGLSKPKAGSNDKRA